MGILVLILGSGAYLVLNTDLTEHSEEPVFIGIVEWVSNDQYDQNILGFQKMLSQHGYIEEDNVEYNIHTSDADTLMQREIIQHFIEKEVDLIYSLTTPGTLIAKEMTSDIPIVFSIVTYPVEAGMIDSLENSGNNLVGTRNYIPIDVQFDFYVELYSIQTIGFVHRDGETNSGIQLTELQEYASMHGFQVIDIAGTSLEHLEFLITEQISSVDSLYNACDTLVQSGGELIAIQIATANNKPTFSCNQDGVRIGAIAGKVSDFHELGKLSGSKAVKILHGEDPSNLKTEGSSVPYTIVNKITFDALELTMPEGLQYGVRELVR